MLSHTPIILVIALTFDNAIDTSCIIERHYFFFAQFTDHLRQQTGAGCLSPGRLDRTPQWTTFISNFILLQY